MIPVLALALALQAREEVVPVPKTAVKVAVVHVPVEGTVLRPYALGKHEILKLRDEWIARTGRSRREFHDALLALGAPPLPVARAILLGERERD